MQRILIVALLVIFPSLGLAQQPYAGMETRSIKTLSEQQIADLDAGRGMGFALAAELNGYPGPSHAIELAERLVLSADQVDELKRQFEAMKAETIPLGRQLVSEERNLNEKFAYKAITLRALESDTQRIGDTQAKLRAAHLKYHLSTVTILTPQQVDEYNRLRGYAGVPPQQHGHMHR